MNLNEAEIGKKIIRHLNVAANQLDQTTLDKLKTVRLKALEAYSHQPSMQTAPAVAGAGRDISFGGRGSLLWVPLATLLLALGGLVYWQSMAHNDFDEVDAMLLSDELPIHTLTSQEFESWLNKSSR
ncbi:MAG: DUF3619 family protein [Burkholderiales bacterium]